MPGAVEAINGFLKALNSSGIPEKLKEEFDRRRNEEDKLRKSVAGMKDAPPPKKDGGPDA